MHLRALAVILLAAGVRFAMGSDPLRTMFGENARELGWFVKAGMTPKHALRAATVNAAELLRRWAGCGSGSWPMWWPWRAIR